MGITSYTSLRYAHNNPMKEGFTYQPENDVFICKEREELTFSKLILKKGTGYYRLYRKKAWNMYGLRQAQRMPIIG
jgi:hypothetical protein